MMMQQPQENRYIVVSKQIADRLNAFIALFGNMKDLPFFFLSIVTGGMVVCSSAINVMHFTLTYKPLFEQLPGNIRTLKKWKKETE